MALGKSFKKGAEECSLSRLPLKDRWSNLSKMISLPSAPIFLRCTLQRWELLFSSHIVFLSSSQSLSGNHTAFMFPP
jgi:hypothetical protein